MNTRKTTLVLVVATLSIGCAAATGPQSLPQETRFSRTNSAHIDVGSMRSADDLLRILPRSLARHGYFIIQTQQRSPDGLQFVTDWRVRPVFIEEAFDGVQQARTRLIVDAKRRGTRYSLTIFAESFLEDENGAWRASSASERMQKHLQEMGTAMAMDVK